MKSISSKFDISDITNEIVVPGIDFKDFSDVIPSVRHQKDLFGDRRKKAWHTLSVDEARCDMKPCIRLTKRGVFFVSAWKKSLFGRTLKELKEDKEMVSVFANTMVPIIREIIGANLNGEDFAVVCAPRRRHLDWNFGHATADAIAKGLQIPFFPDCCKAKNRQRVNAVFTANNIPPHRNLIVYDDIVTSGQTLSAVKRLLADELGKNLIFFTNINNKL